MFPGIRFDPREPIPPGFDNYDMHIAVQPDVPFHRVRRHRHPDARALFRPVELDARDQREEPSRQQGFLPPVSAKVNIQVVHDTAKFTVTHIFCNVSSVIKHGVYQFPLPLEATITEFNCRIGQTRMVRGKVKPKEEARREFEDVVRQNRTGGLLEQQTPEIFTTTLGNIPAKTEVRAELSFVCLLKHKISVDCEVFTLTVPTYIAPRYGDLPPGVVAEPQEIKTLSLEVDVLTAEELVSVNSDTHIISYQTGAGQRPCQTWQDFIMRGDDRSADLRSAMVKLLHGCTTLDKDLVLTIHTALGDKAEIPQACLEIHPNFENHKALMLTLPSNFMLQAERFNHNGEIIFVADRSGSMSDKIQSLKKAMMFFINGIPKNRPFNIWCFGSNFTSMWPKSKVFNEESKQEATDYVCHRFASDMGGTEILPALEAIYNARGSYHSMDIIVLTDGQVWRPVETINFVKEKWKMSEGIIRFFSLGIGAAVSHELVEGIAKAGGGYAEVITSASSGGWEDRVVAVLKAATTSHAGPFRMELEWQENEDFQRLQNSKYRQSPVDLSAISPFIRNRLFLLLDSGDPIPELKAIVLKARGANGTDINRMVLPRQLHLPDSTIHKLAARALLGDLERGESCLHQNTGINAMQATLDKLVRDEAVTLGCKYSLVSKWTSLYAVEEESPEPNDEEMDLNIENIRPNDEPKDILLLPRGALGLNPGGLLDGAEVDTELDDSEEEGETDTDTADSEQDARFDRGPGDGGESDDDSDGDGDNPDHGGGGGNAGNAGMDAWAGEGRKGGEERDPPQDRAPHNDTQGNLAEGNNRERAPCERAPYPEADSCNSLSAAQQSRGWEFTATREAIIPSVPPLPQLPPLSRYLHAFERPKKVRKVDRDPRPSRSSY